MVNQAALGCHRTTTTYKYDADNHPVEVSYSDGKTPTVRYEYNGDGDRTKMVDGTGTSTYEYDQLDRLTEVEDGHGDTTGYEYNLAGEQTKITYPNGKAVTREYDEAGRLKNLTDWLGNTTKFSYDADSDLTATTFPSGTGDEDTYAYDEADAMSEVKMAKGSETLASIVYARDKDGLVTKATSKGLPGAEVTEADYDENNRLTKYGSTEYKYDAASNPTKEGSSESTYNEGDELEKGGGETYSYNEVGERTKAEPSSGPATTYGYDQAGNLTSVERPEGESKPKIEDTYAYNGDGLRASQTINSTTSYLAWDTAEQLPLLLNDGTNSYIYGPGGLPIEQIDSEGTPTYLHHDQQGSTRLLTNASGENVGTTTYDAYGNVTGSTGTGTSPLGYDAQYTDSDTGLIYLRARVYDPTTAQFLSVDPKAEVTRTIYSYAQDNPLTGGDPTGEWYEPLGEEERKYMQYYAWIDNKVRASLLARHEHSRLDEFTILASHIWSLDLQEISRGSLHEDNAGQFESEEGKKRSEAYEAEYSKFAKLTLAANADSWSDVIKNLAKLAEGIYEVKGLQKELRSL